MTKRLIVEPDRQAFAALGGWLKSANYEVLLAAVPDPDLIVPDSRMNSPGAAAWEVGDAGFLEKPSNPVGFPETIEQTPASAASPRL